MLGILRELPGSRILRHWATNAEGWWFDTTRGVRTAGLLVPKQPVLSPRYRQTDFWYNATRPHTARSILANLPIHNHHEYTFVDLGSGKGRMLLLAAEYSFSRIEGVEFAKEFHDVATDNIRRYLRKPRPCENIHSLNLDAAEYLFPEGKIVLYFFSSFGPDLVALVLKNLTDSLRKNPREVILVSAAPHLSWLRDRLRQARLYHETSRYSIYQISDSRMLE